MSRQACTRLALLGFAVSALIAFALAVEGIVALKAAASRGDLHVMQWGAGGEN